MLLNLFNDRVNVSNPNLIDNWYFGNPVNQRGKSSYTGSGYGIDRWKATNDKTKVTITSLLGLTLQSTDSTVQPFLAQIIENSNQLLGKTVTLSALTREGTLFKKTDTFPETWPNTGDYEFYCNTLNICDIVYNISSNVLSVRIKANKDNAEGIALKAIKLELGDTQTLAHKEGTIWVVNEIPDYDLELLKCQRYFQIVGSPYNAQENGIMGYASNTGDVLVNFNLSVPMRISPEVTANDLSLFTIGKRSSTTQTIKKVTAGWATRINNSCNMRSVIFTTTDHTLTAGDNYVLYLLNGAEIQFSAEP